MACAAGGGEERPMRGLVICLAGWADIHQDANKGHNDSLAEAGKRGPGK